MKLRTFTAPDMPAAMEMVRSELGNEAVILSSSRQNGHAVCITAAVNRDESESPQRSTGPDSHRLISAGDLRFSVQEILRFHNLPEMFVARMIQKAGTDDFASAAALHRISGNRDTRHLHRLAMEKLMSAFFTFDPLALESKKLRIMLVGQPGAGKTLTIAKLAARLAMNKQPLTVITTDNKRAGGIEQLKAFTDIIGLDLKVAATREELMQHIAAAHPRVLVDTAGCNPYQADELRELESLATVGGVEPVLVVAAGGDSLESIDMVEAFSGMPLRRMLVTRTDTARRFGSVLAAAAANGLAFANTSHSASIIDPLHPIAPPLLAELLLRYQS